MGFVPESQLRTGLPARAKGIRTRGPSLAAKRPEGGLKLGAVETVRKRNRLVRFWSDSQTHQVVLRVAQPACRARCEHLQQRVFGIGRDLERDGGGIFLEPVAMAGTRDGHD